MGDGEKRVGEKGGRREGVKARGGRAQVELSHLAGGVPALPSGGQPSPLRPPSSEGGGALPHTSSRAKRAPPLSLGDRPEPPDGQATPLTLPPLSRRPVPHRLHPRASPPCRLLVNRVSSPVPLIPFISSYPLFSPPSPPSHSPLPSSQLPFSLPHFPSALLLSTFSCPPLDLPPAAACRHLLALPRLLGRDLLPTPSSAQIEGHACSRFTCLEQPLLLASPRQTHRVQVISLFRQAICGSFSLG